MFNMNKKEVETTSQKKALTLFISQIIVSAIITIICLINITLKSENPIWFVLLGSALGLFIPNPKLDGDKLTKSAMDATDSKNVVKC